MAITSLRFFPLFMRKDTKYFRHGKIFRGEMLQGMTSDVPLHVRARVCKAFQKEPSPSQRKYNTLFHSQLRHSHARTNHHPTFTRARAPKNAHRFPKNGERFQKNGERFQKNGERFQKNGERFQKIGARLRRGNARLQKSSKHFCKAAGTETCCRLSAGRSPPTHGRGAAAPAGNCY